MADELVESGALDEADRANEAQIPTNTEWTRRGWTHVHTILTAWAVGVLSADPWHRGFRLVEHFEAVFNHIARRLQERFPGEDVVEVSLHEVRQWLREWAMECPEYRAWNERGGSGVSWRGSPTPTSPQFIDLDVSPHNAALYIRNERRHDRAFERRTGDRT